MTGNGIADSAQWLAQYSKPTNNTLDDDIWYLVFAEVLKGAGQGIPETGVVSNWGGDIWTKRNFEEWQGTLKPKASEGKEFVEHYWEEPIKTYQDNAYEFSTKDLRKWLRSMRLVSRRFDSILLPYVYEFLDLSVELNSSNGLFALIGPTAKIYIQNYARGLILGCHQDQDRCLELASLVAGCKKLSYTCWEGVCPGFFKDGETMAYKDKLSTRYVHAFLLSVSGSATYDFGNETSVVRALRTRKPALESTITLSEKTYQHPYMPTHTPTLPQTRSLDHFQVTSDIFVYESVGLSPTGEKLPPMKKLSWQGDISSPCGSFSVDLWDFSSLKSLHLKDTFLCIFLRALTEDLVGTLRQLKSLKLEEDLGQCTRREYHEETMMSQMKYLIPSFNKLEELKLCKLGWRGVVELATVLGVGKNLRILYLREANWSEDSALSPAEVLMIRDACPSIEKLELPVSILSLQNTGSLRLFRDLSSLRSLFLYTWYKPDFGAIVDGDDTIVDGDDAIVDGDDATKSLHESSYELILKMRHEKFGVEYDVIRICVFLPTEENSHKWPGRVFESSKNATGGIDFSERSV